MDVVNAISKVRFSAAKPQLVSLQKVPGLSISLLCMQPGQSFPLPPGPHTCYVVTGSALVTCGGSTTPLAPGHCVAAQDGEAHLLACRGEDRAVCLVYRPE
ncbi:MAG: cupin domain-containing protein [Planctomycetota bacterium]|nr:cupin domain-containing protein [Planctomycetota bacterium]